VTLAPSDLTAPAGAPTTTSSQLLATALAEVNTTHDLEQVGADTWAAWARTELKRAHALRRCGS
jgi:hypothetical protein